LSVAILLLRAPDLLKAEERADLERVLAADAPLDAGYKLVQRFRGALHDLDVTAFHQWLLDAAASDLKPFLRELTSSWSMTKRTESGDTVTTLKLRNTGRVG
jgi:hypothetical protein